MKLCVYAICKDELKFIDKWLENMSEADYIVVLDTGSTDGTYEFLKKDPRVTRVEQKEIKPWRFDVARNESMKLIPADTDVCICTDPDELFDPGWANQIRTKWIVGKTIRGEYNYAWNHDENGKPVLVYKYNKIHANDPRFHWIFPCHERVELSDDDVSDYKIIKDGSYLDFEDSILLHHWQDTTKSRSNYLDLLKLSAEENPKNLHITMLYARELIIQNKLEEGINIYLKLLANPEIDKPEWQLTLLDSLLLVSNTYYSLNKVDLAIWYAQEFIRVNPTYREPYLLLATIYANQGLYVLAKGYIELAKKYCFRHYDWVEHSDAYAGWIERLEAEINNKLPPEVV